MLKKLKSIFLTTLGLTDFEKNSEGESVLNEEHKAKLTNLFGSEAISLFEKEMAKEKSTEESTSAEESSDALVGAIREHLAKQTQQDLKDMQQKLAQAEQDKKELQSTVLKLSKAPEMDPEPETTTNIPKKEGIKNVMKVNLSLPHYQAAQEMLTNGVMPSASNATLDVLDVKKEFGQFLSNHNNLEVVNQLFNGFTSAKYFKTVPATTEYRAIQALITSVVQAFTPKWTPSGSTKFTPLVIPNRRHKINFPIIPAQVLDSYLFHLYDEQLSPDQMPITKYIWQELLLPQILDDIELRMVGKGKYEPVEWSSVTEGDAGTPPEKGMDGLETLLVEQKKLGANSKVNFFEPTPAFDFKTATDEQVLKHVEDFVDYLSPVYRNMKMNIYCSFEFWKRYRRAYKKVWGVNSGQDGDFGSNKVDFSNNVLVPLDCLYGSPILFSTPPSNMVKLRHKNEVPLVINDVQRINYEVRLFGEFWLAVGFAIAEAVFAYVPDNYDPQAVLTSTYGAADKFRDGTSVKTESDIYKDMPVSFDEGSSSGSSSGQGGI